MSAVGILAFVVPLLGSGVRTDVATGADLSARAGLIPQDASRMGEPGGDGGLTFFAGGRLLSVRTSLRLIYSPRFSVQVPGTIELGRPLVLHSLGAYYDTAIGRRTHFGLELRGSAGEISYSYFNQVATPGTSTVAPSTIPLLITTGSAELDHRTSARNRVSAELTAGYQTQPEVLFGDTEARSFPTSFYSDLTLADRYELTERDEISLYLHGGYISAEEEAGEQRGDVGDTTVFGGGLSLRRELSLRSELTLDGGGDLTYVSEDSALDFVPRIVVSHATNWRGEAQTWRLGSSGGVRGFLDRVSATYRSQGFASVELLGTFGRDWSSGVNFFGFTSLAPAPLSPPQLESAVSLTQSNGYRISPNLSLRFGASGSVRAPHRLEEDLSSQAEVTGFFGLRYTEGTDRDRGAWLR